MVSDWWLHLCDVWKVAFYLSRAPLLRSEEGLSQQWSDGSTTSWLCASTSPWRSHRLWGGWTRGLSWVHFTTFHSTRHRFGWKKVSKVLRVRPELHHGGFFFMISLGPLHAGKKEEQQARSFPIHSITDETNDEDKKRQNAVSPMPFDQSWINIWAKASSATAE